MQGDFWSSKTVGNRLQGAGSKATDAAWPAFELAEDRWESSTRLRRQLVHHQHVYAHTRQRVTGTPMVQNGHSTGFMHFFAGISINHGTTEDFMQHENENAAKRHSGFKRRDFMTMLAGCTAGMMVPSLFHGDEKLAAATSSAPTAWANFCPCASWVLPDRL